MVGEEMWPTLNEAHGNSITPDETSSAAQVDEWEIVRQDGDDDAEDEGVEIRVVPTSLRKLRHCASSPDLRFIGKALEAVDEEDDGVTIDSMDSEVIVSKKMTSFRDAILSPSKHVVLEEKKEQESIPATRQRKIKPKIVVKTPSIRRCSKSTGDLQSLVSIHEEEVLGETDAMDYYHRKAMGDNRRVNGLKIRPDELKRKTFTLNKKQEQRQQQQLAA